MEQERECRFEIFCSKTESGKHRIMMSLNDMEVDIETELKGEDLFDSAISSVKEAWKKKNIQ